MGCYKNVHRFPVLKRNLNESTNGDNDIVYGVHG